jgi:poly(3-hydroxybutyrate) depolymerase
MGLRVYLLFCGILADAAILSCCTGLPDDRSSRIQAQIASLPPVTVPETGGVPAGRSRYVFSDMHGNADRPITVYTYRPASWNTSGPVLIAMHGAGRSAAPSRDIWAPYGDRYSCLIIAPEFSTQYYTGDEWYAGGNLFDNQGNRQPQQNWTYMAIENVFDDIRNRSGARQETYLIFGHSAGAQFVHRMVIFLPEARYSRAVAANAGVYAMPTCAVGYGSGLRGSPHREVDLPRVFSRKLIIMAGGEDTDPVPAGLPPSRRQKHRAARGSSGQRTTMQLHRKRRRPGTSR